LLLVGIGERAARETGEWGEREEEEEDEEQPGREDDEPLDDDDEGEVRLKRKLPSTVAGGGIGRLGDD
jgi:hypothetical protein